MNIYDLLHGFWKENEYEPFPTSAIALFFFLIERANSRHWKMPVSCPTSFICHVLSMSRQTVITSRDILRKRGMIMYTKGDFKGAVPSYTLVVDWKKWTSDLSMDQTTYLTGNLTASSTVDLTVDLTTYNKKDRKNKENISLKRSETEKKIKIDELERIFLSDVEWQEAIISTLPKAYSLSADSLKGQISHFFNLLRCQRIDEREEKDCRNHFFNWLNKILKENADGNSKQSDTDRRRGSDVTASSARDYNGAF